LTRWTQYRRYRHRPRHRHRHQYNGIPPYVVGETRTVGCTANLRGVRREKGSGEVGEGPYRHRHRDRTNERNTKAGGHRIRIQWW
jgi:polyribonucleotide nucleotidyltransferase